MHHGGGVGERVFWPPSQIGTPGMEGNLFSSVLTGAISPSPTLGTDLRPRHKSTF